MGNKIDLSPIKVLYTQKFSSIDKILPHMNSNDRRPMPDHISYMTKNLLLPNITELKGFFGYTENILMANPNVEISPTYKLIGLKDSLKGGQSNYSLGIEKMFNINSPSGERKDLVVAADINWIPNLKDDSTLYLYVTEINSKVPTLPYFWRGSLKQVSKKGRNIFPKTLDYSINMLSSI